jgi:hypothetical protein
MALPIKVHSILEGKDAIRFQKESNENLKLKGIINLNPQRDIMKLIIKKSNI